MNAHENILLKILTVKHTEIAHARALVPIAALKARLKDAPPVKNFRTALASPDTINIIAEIKHKSPSKGIIRSPFDPHAIYSAYEKNGAAAVSVLTDESFFGGSLQYLSALSRNAQLPLLRKDFIIDEYQIYEARAHGADAVLLIAGALDSDALRRLYTLTYALAMTALVEVHNQEELDKALALNPEIIGINNRDLTTFNVSLETTILLEKSIPADTVVVSESGISTHADIIRLRQHAVHAFLIGEQFMRADDIGSVLRMMRGEQ